MNLDCEVEPLSRSAMSELITFIDTLSAEKFNFFFGFFLRGLTPKPGSSQLARGAKPSRRPASLVAPPATVAGRPCRAPAAPPVEFR